MMLAGLDNMLHLFLKDESGFTLLDAEELVDVRVHFIADFFFRLQAHYHELQMLTGE
jgi:hypothetical protein